MPEPFGPTCDTPFRPDPYICDKSTVHTRRLDDDAYPVRDLVDLLKASRYEGWVLLEQGGQAPADLVGALRDQRERFESLVGDE